MKSFFAHPGPHTTEGISHYLSGWHLMILLLAVAFAVGIAYLAQYIRKPSKEEAEEREE